MNNGKIDYLFGIKPMTVKKLRDLLDIVLLTVENAEDVPVTILTERSQETATWANYVEETEDDGTTITRKFTIE